MIAQYWQLAKLISCCNSSLRYSKYFALLLILLGLVSRVFPALMLTFFILAGLFLWGLGILLSPFQIRQLFNNPHLYFMPGFRIRYVITLLAMLISTSIYLHAISYWLVPNSTPADLGIRFFGLASLFLGFMLVLSKSPAFQFVMFIPVMFGAVSPGFWHSFSGFIQIPVVTALLMLLTIAGWGWLLALAAGKNSRLEKLAVPFLINAKGQNQFWLNNLLQATVNSPLKGDARSSMLALLRMPSGWRSFLLMVVLPLFATPCLPVLFFWLTVAPFSMTSAPRLYLLTQVFFACGILCNYVKSLYWLRLVWLRIGADRLLMWQHHEHRMVWLFAAVFLMTQLSLLLGLFISGITMALYVHLTLVLLTGPWFCYYLILFASVTKREWLLSFSFVLVIIPLFWIGTRSLVGNHHLEFAALIVALNTITVVLRQKSARAFSMVNWQTWRPLYLAGLNR